MVLAFDREQLSSTNPLGTNDESSAIHTGLGLEAGAGIDLHPGGPFGLTIGGGYRWTGFSEDVGGRSSYEGWGADIGVTYRFQYQYSSTDLAGGSGLPPSAYLGHSQPNTPPVSSPYISPSNIESSVVRHERLYQIEY